MPQAKQACQKINQDFPENADGWYATSFLAFQLKNTELALATIDKAIQLQPTALQWQLQKVNTLLLMSDKSAAKVLAKFLKHKQAADLAQCHDLAMMFTKLNDFTQAQYYYQQALAFINQSKHPKERAQVYFNLASISRYQGNINLAEQQLNQALTLNPKDYEAYLLRASLKKQSKTSNHIAQLKQVLAQGIKQPICKAQIHYALAKELEDIQQYPQSFEQLSQGAKARRDCMRYDVEQDILTLQKITTTFNQYFFKQYRGSNAALTSTEGVAGVCENSEAIFILGLPRTGSTLVDRIISHHSDVFSAGELNNFALCMMDEIQKTAKSAPKSRQELVEVSRNIDFKTLGENYIKSTRPETGLTKKFIDKLPLNSLYVGLIHLALPKAKIIHVTRHPLDTCYSIYKQMFTNGYPFSYELTELAKYYIAHHKMMQHWYRVLPNVIHQVAYEDVVNDLTVEAKKLLAYCQLDWQAQCVDFQNNSAPATTASASQVREKIYTSSAGKWRHYAKELQPIKQLLVQAGIACD
ncbi:Tetratricopeptide repeat-containing protein [Colwellia chukchiensis]|uniref:Tetratricopeptide repeat-containing protein n=1 Tax=Colwellia chukchiensis TaxID=641665 RepID=A0A1H7SIM2_9GAMM|nr:sulfotransferase [Colwellia chukchiensis]SEL72219.1 Tetratricopeptide repeat-containing protein [Colwellia chukchiensis]